MNKNAPALPAQLKQNRVVSVHRLVPHARNYRKHPPEQIERLVASLQRFGQGRSICVQDGADALTIVAGHGVVEAVLALGWHDIRADILPADWTDEQITGYLVADNLHEQFAEDDEGILLQLLQEQQDVGFSLESLGTGEAELQQLIEERTAQLELPLTGLGGEDFNTTPQLAGPTRTHPGDLWQLGKHRLLVGDCTNPDDMARLMQGEQADILFTDPPYGVDYHGGGHFNDVGEYVAHTRERMQGDTDTEIYAAFLPVVLPYVNGPCYVWFADIYGHELYTMLFELQCDIHAHLVWHKTNAKYAAVYSQYKQRCELCLYFKPRGSTLRWIGPTDECTLWELPRDAQNEFHPAQKPVALSARAIGNHDVRTVLDVFAGSGSTLIAAERAHKTCYLMEIEPHYADVILARWEAETGKTAVCLEGRDA